MVSHSVCFTALRVAFDLDLTLQFIYTGIQLDDSPILDCTSRCILVEHQTGVGSSLDSPTFIC